MTDDDLKLLVRDALAVLPDNLESEDIACILANIAAAYAPEHEDAIGHLMLALATVTVGDKS